MGVSLLSREAADLPLGVEAGAMEEQRRPLPDPELGGQRRVEIHLQAAIVSCPSRGPRGGRDPELERRPLPW